jgi:SAM-dependent methyltransferase
MLQLTRAEVAKLDPYALMAVLGKRVIHPGGRRSTEELLRAAQIAPGDTVLDVGCGVGTTAIAVAERFGAAVTAADIAPMVLDRARNNVRRARVEDHVTVEQADISALPYPDASFDRVIAEAVTMFVDRPAAAKELARVCRPGGRVLATEFLWRTSPSEEARRAFLHELCPGMTFDTLDDWIGIYSAAGLSDITVTCGPFEMMTPRGFIRDEGLIGSVGVMGRAMMRPAYLKKMLWIMPRIAKAVPYLGYVVVAGARA